MSQVIVAQRMWQRRDTAANWAAANPVLAAGEIGVELGGTPEETQFKIGDGSTPWNALPYFSGEFDLLQAYLSADETSGVAGSDGVLVLQSGVLRLARAEDFGGGGGEPVELRATATHIQWRQVGDPTWHDLVPLSELEGPPGDDGDDGAPGPPALWIADTAPASTALLWLDTSVNELKFYNGSTWQTLVVGAKGDPGPPGASSGQFLFGAGDRVRPLPIGEKGIVPVTFSGTIQSMRMVIVTSDGEPGDIDVDIRKCSFADFSSGRPGVGDSIAGVSRPTISGALKVEDLDLVGWAAEFEDGDVFVPVVLGRSSNVTHFALALRTEKDT